MDYYEELGIAPSATLEEIHRAHRRLSKLFHPDQQSDHTMKLLAETQMRRLNSIVGILSDPELRHQYDCQLRGSAVSDPARIGGNVSGTDDLKLFFPWQPRRRLVPWWVSTPLLAVCLSAAVVWFWADESGASFRRAVPKEVARTGGKEAASKKAPATPKQSSEPPQKRPKADSNVGARSTALQGDKANLREVTADVPSTNEKPGRRSGREDNRNDGPNKESRLARILQRPAVPRVPSRAEDQPSIAPPPIITVASDQPEMPAALLPVPARPRLTDIAAAGNPLAGEWVYAGKEPESRKPGFYPPEFIDLKLFPTESSLHGRYQARYRVTDQPVSPDVSFSVFPADRKSRKFVWQSANGSRGTLKIKPIDSTTIRVEWRTTVYSAQLALTGGTATLVRRSP